MTGPTIAALALCVATAACEKSAPKPPPQRTTVPPPPPARVESSSATPTRSVVDTMTTLVVDSTLESPLIVRVRMAHVLHLPAAMRAALDSLVPDYRTATLGEFDADIREFVAARDTTAALFAVVGDFDGDGRLDVVMLGNRGLVVVFNAASGARAMCVEPCAAAVGAAVPGQRGEYLELQPRGRLTIPDIGGDDGKPTALTLTADGFQNIFFEKAAELYYYRDGKWITVATAD